MTTRRSFATLAIVLLILVAGVALLYAVRAQVPPASVSSSSPTPARPTSVATASPSTASPVPSPAPTPIGFVLPQDCSYVRRPLPATPAPATPVTYWEFTCAGAATPDLKAVERIAPAFAQQGWTPCPSNPGTGVWWKGATQTMVGQGSPYPGLSQLARQSQDCP